MGAYENLTEEDFKSVVEGFMKTARDELLALTEEELRTKRWYFKYEPKYSKEWNLYEFASSMELYKSSCRDWETHHNGYVCVVERVRDKYLMPRIKEFYAALEASEASDQ